MHARSKIGIQTSGCREAVSCRWW